MGERKMGGDRWIVCMAIWLALASQAMAHPPYVEPWKHAATLCIAGLAGVCTAVLMLKKCGIIAALVTSVVVALMCGVLGFVLSIATSM